MIRFAPIKGSGRAAAAGVMVASLSLAACPTAAMQPVPLEDARLLSVRVENTEIEPALDALIRDGVIYLPIVRLVELTEHPHEVTPDGRLLVGEGVEIALTPGDGAVVEDGIPFIALDRAQSLLSIRLDAEDQADVLRISPAGDAALPVAERLRREAVWRRLPEPIANDELPRAIDPPYVLYAPLMGDVTLTARHDSDGGGQIDYNGLLVGELAWLTHEFYVSGRADQAPDDLRLRSGRRSYSGGVFGVDSLYEALAGDVFGYTTPLVGRSGIGRGLSLTGRPPTQPTDFDVTRIEGDAPPGWDVELYRNGELLAIMRVGPDGRYRFEDAPLMPGRNQMVVRFYGPQGQMREESRAITVGADTPAPGAVYWAAYLNQPDKRLLSGLIDRSDQSIGMTPRLLGGGSGDCRRQRGPQAAEDEIDLVLGHAMFDKPALLLLDRLQSRAPFAGSDRRVDLGDTDAFGLVAMTCGGGDERRRGHGRGDPLEPPLEDHLADPANEGFRTLLARIGSEIGWARPGQGNALRDTGFHEDPRLRLAPGHASEVGLGARLALALPASEPIADLRFHRVDIEVADDDKRRPLRPIISFVKLHETLARRGSDHFRASDRKAIGRQLARHVEGEGIDEHSKRWRRPGPFLGENDPALAIDGGSGKRRLVCDFAHQEQGGIHRFRVGLGQIELVDGLSEAGGRVGIGTEAEPVSLEPADELAFGHVGRAVQDHMLEEVSDPALVLRLVKRAGVDPEPQRRFSRRGRIPADGVTHPVGKHAITDGGISGQIAFLVWPDRFGRGCGGSFGDRGRTRSLGGRHGRGAGSQARGKRERGNESAIHSILLELKKGCAAGQNRTRAPAVNVLPPLNWNVFGKKNPSSRPGVLAVADRMSGSLASWSKSSPSRNKVTSPPHGPLKL